jgi:hypothetical protein
VGTLLIYSSQNVCAITVIEHRSWGWASRSQEVKYFNTLTTVPFHLGK